MTPRTEQEKMYTEKDVILREREAFVDGAIHGAAWPDRPNERYRSAAEHRYPLPKVTRPRVVRDRGDYAWKMVDGVLYYSGNGENWYSASGCSFCPTVERIALLSDLLANPTEQTDDA